jgi:large repetitive protein
MSIVDTFPGRLQIRGKARPASTACRVSRVNGPQLTWGGLRLAATSTRSSCCWWSARASARGNTSTGRRCSTACHGGEVSGEATATVRVIPDPTFDCTDVIGKVFDDATCNGYQDAGEKGLPGFAW